MEQTKYNWHWIEFSDERCQLSTCQLFINHVARSQLLHHEASSCTELFFVHQSLKIPTHSYSLTELDDVFLLAFFFFFLCFFFLTFFVSAFILASTDGNIHLSSPLSLALSSFTFLQLQAASAWRQCNSAVYHITL